MKQPATCGGLLSRSLFPLLELFSMKTNISCNSFIFTGTYRKSTLISDLMCIFRWLKEQFKKADKDKTGVLTFKQVQELLERINIKPSRKYAKDLFNVCVL